MPRPLILALLMLALAGYGASLFLHPFACQYGEGVMGYHVLMWGWFEMFSLDPRWYANLTAAWLTIATVRGHPPRHRVPMALLTLGLALASAGFPAPGCGDGQGAELPSLGLQAGGYLWIGAVSMMACCALPRPRRFPRR